MASVLSYTLWVLREHVPFCPLRSSGLCTVLLMLSYQRNFGGLTPSVGLFIYQLYMSLFIDEFTCKPSIIYRCSYD